MPFKNIAGLVTLAALAACVPRVQLPVAPYVAQGIVAPGDSVARLARHLAPVLYVQRDEPFPLVRVAAVVHPTRPVIAYHMLWQHDVNGQWLPWAKPSDEEIVWVGYDPQSGDATDIWTYWHNTVLHTDWRGRGMPGIDVQWGKHGSLPHHTIESDLPRFKTLNAFYAVEFLLLPDIWIGKLAHGGPWGFFHGYGRYREFTNIDSLANRIDAVIAAEDPRDQLHAVFGRKYSNKLRWPWNLTAPDSGADSLYVRETMKEYLMRTFGPVPAGRAIALAGYNQALGRPRNFPRTWHGYEDRLATAYVQVAISHTLRSAGSRLVDQRVMRFQRCRCAGSSRFVYAVETPMRVTTPNGVRLSFLNPVTEVASGILVTPLHGPGIRVGEGIVSGAIGIASESGWALVREYWPWQWRPPFV
jgi:hypothetical protein